MMKDLVNNILQAYRSKTRYIVNEGGTRSGKTFSVLSALYIIADTTPNILISVVSETYPHLRRGAIRDFQSILTSWGVWRESQYNKTEGVYTLDNGSRIEFFSCDSPDKVHGPARDILFMNEAQNISYDIARHLFVRTTGTIFIDFNPTHEFWAHTEIQPDQQTAWIHSTYIDNPFLTPEQVAEIEKNRKNLHWWTVYGEGKIGRLDGLVFPEFALIDSIPEGVVFYGLDFGYTNDPAALVACVIRDDKLYIEELIYNTGLSNAELSARMKVIGISRTAEIYADSAEPKSIDDLHLMGWNVKPATKGSDSIRWGIDVIKKYNIHITKQSVNLIKEFRNYTWAKDKEGKLLNAPIDLWNHSIDAVRYAVSMRQRSMIQPIPIKKQDKSFVL